jgi:2-dehydro-3-deoxygluconokinase
MTATELDILSDDLSIFDAPDPAFVTLGEVMVRDTPADMERPERTRLVHLSMAGSEFTLAMGLSRLGIPSRFVTRVPKNPYGIALENIAREQGVDTDYFVWAPKTEPMGRLIYELGRTPRKTIGVYQRMYSAASRLDAGMVDWEAALVDAKLFHTSGITFGLSTHSKYDRNYCRDAFNEAIQAKPSDCLVGLDFNYRGTLWSPEVAKNTMTPILGDHVDLLITTIEDMAKLYGISCGQYSAKVIVDGDIGPIEDDDILAFGEQILEKFNVKVVAVTIRYPDSFETHRWESAVVDQDGNLFRSPVVRSITLLDRLGITEGGIRKGVFVGDAATRLKQTLMFDLPIVDKEEIQALIKSDWLGGGKRVER